jgi:2-phospho-L-lactate guanylyltransferase
MKRPPCAVVPVKLFSNAKTRLAGVLAPEKRARVARMMFEDVLGTVTAHRGLFERVLIVTADAMAAQLAAEAGAEVIDERPPYALNQAVIRAARAIVRQGGEGMLVVPSDLPQMSGSVLRRAVELLASPRAVVAARAGDGGTNLLGCRPVYAIGPSFGPGSFSRHCLAARRVGITPVALLAPAIGPDLDLPGDLAAFLRVQGHTRTHEYLRALRPSLAVRL